MRTHSARVGRAGDEAGADSVDTVALGSGCVVGSVVMSRVSFLPLIVLPEYYDRI